jgi:redox-sensitive bicupin YhaK (pirin superfamily)
MSGYVFPPHPHAGFSAVSYMLEESEGSFQNNDSAGLSVKIHPGDLHWTFAGRGIMHEEYPDKKGVVCRGLQIFINAPIKNKMDPPSVVRVTKNEQPIWKSEDGAVAVRVVTGEYRGVKSPGMSTVLSFVFRQGLLTNKHLAYSEPCISHDDT